MSYYRLNVILGTEYLNRFQTKHKVVIHFIITCLYVDLYSSIVVIKISLK